MPDATATKGQLEPQFSTGSALRRGGSSGAPTLDDMQMAASSSFLNILATQAEVISRRQARAAGMSASRIDNMLRSKRWQALQQGVYAAFSGSPGREAQLWAVTLRAGPRSALSFRTAAELYGLVTDQTPLVHVTVPSSQRTRPIRGAVVHYSATVDRVRQPTLLPPRTSIEETVLDLVQASDSLDEAIDWICRAVSRRLTTSNRLSAALAIRRRMKWRNDLRLALGDIDDGGQSILELRYITSVEREHGLPRARRQVPFRAGGRSAQIDNLYDDASLAVELDGRAYHPPEQRSADNRRDGALATLGILTVRYSWADVATRPCDVAAEVAALLAVRGAPVTLRMCGPHCGARLAS
jgi:very-short-patch-repair endonuclease